MRAPVSACVIAREASPGLLAAIKSVEPYVEQVVIAYTAPMNNYAGSSCPRLTDLVFLDCNDAEGRIADFSLARNRAYSFATQPWVLWLDSDDVVHGAENLAAVVRSAERQRAGHPCRVVFPYEYAYDEDGDCCLVQGRERLSTRGNFEWRRPVHEGLFPIEGRVLGPRDVLDESVVWKHQRQYLGLVSYQDPGRNVRILRRMLKDDPGDARTRIDLGTELSIAARVATRESDRYVLDSEARLHLLAAGDDYGAHLMLSQLELREALAACNRGSAFDPHAAETHALAALRLRPWDQPYFELAKISYLRASSGVTAKMERTLLEKAVVYGDAGLAARPTALPHQHDPLERSLRIHETLADCHDRLGTLDKALEHVAAAREAKPRARRLAEQQKSYEAKVVKSRVAADLKTLRSLNAIGESSYEVAREAVEDPTLLHSRIESARKAPRTWDGPVRVSIACGSTLQAWSPESIKQGGSGGSEVAVVEVAKRLAAAGCEVTVFAGDHEAPAQAGVTYRRSGELWLSPACDVLVAWRNAALLEPDVGPVDARARVLWVHDCDPLNMTLGRSFLADRVLALSEWHRSYLLAKWKFAPGQVSLTRNGIDLARFTDRRVTRNPRKAVYSSSPDRGLGELLEVWPRIRARVPDVELHVFYGFEGMRAAAKHLRDPGLAGDADALESQLLAMRDQGVRTRGKVDPQALADEMLSAGAWLYPTEFEETSCITAMEAQCAGLAIVTSPVAALPETASHSLGSGMVWFVDRAAEPSTYDDRFVDAAVVALTRTLGEEDREASAVAARERFDWRGIGEEWVTLFTDVLRERAEGILHPYVYESAAE